MSTERKVLSQGSEWTFELLKEYDRAIGQIAKEYGLETYRNQIEIISTEQMMDAYSTVGMPINYNHWSFGKQFVNVEKGYKHGQIGLAYEIVINSNPCIAYLLEENTMTMQALVIAHASYGHNSFFKGNYLFKTWTNANSIIDYLLFAKNYINKCEEKYGIQNVEAVLDACHALMSQGVDRYKRPAKLSLREEEERQQRREEYLQTQVNDLWRTIPRQDKSNSSGIDERFPAEPQENILYFIEKNAPLLEPWQREIVRIVRKISQYFYPQKQTKVMNEGWACFWHYRLINDLYDQGLLTDEFMLEFLQAHTNVISQPDFDHPHFSGINPYALGYAMMTDIRRICENPTDEDKVWFPDIAGKDWLSTLMFAMRNFKDESFISQYLSPKLIRDFKFFSILDDDQQEAIQIENIHDEQGYHAIRQILSGQYNLGNLEPNIQIYNVNYRGDRSLTLRHYQAQRRPLGRSAVEVLKHIHALWGFDVNLEILSAEGEILDTWNCPPKTKP